MTDPQDPILAAVDLLAPAFDGAGLDELELSVGDLHVRLARPRQPVAVGEAAPPPAAPAPAPAPAESLTPYGAPAPGMRFVSAPLTGIWYPSPSPGARPYVNEGDEVAAGQVIGLIEAMKLFNEIKSDTSGRISRVLVENGTLVKRKQPLLEIDPR
ncbi:MAG TPA: biotin/lipoyl-containing protein [Candidatus Limnocylindria bacterium]|jgi:acetyl-CoA carboxylase biotin carboxyl carrier protein|nr:biotin/lipoyl-containing protein [Candidatus Limnocylindria bacterium]